MVNQQKLDTVYGSIATKINFDFIGNKISLNLQITEEKVVNYELTFKEVNKFYVSKDWSYYDWEIITIAEIFHIPELGQEYNICKSKREKYNYLIDGDNFKIYIHANKANLTKME